MTQGLAVLLLACCYIFCQVAQAEVTVTRENKDSSMILVKEGELSFVSYGITYPENQEYILVLQKGRTNIHPYYPSQGQCGRPGLEISVVTSRCTAESDNKTDWYVLTIRGDVEMNGVVINCKYRNRATTTLGNHTDCGANMSATIKIISGDAPDVPPTANPTPKKPPNTTPATPESKTGGLGISTTFETPTELISGNSDGKMMTLGIMLLMILILCLGLIIVNTIQLICMNKTSYCNRMSHCNRTDVAEIMDTNNTSSSELVNDAQDDVHVRRPDMHSQWSQVSQKEDDEEEDHAQD